MSLENAQEFIKKLNDGDSAILKLLPDGVMPKNIGGKEIAKIANAAATASCDFSAEELQEAYLDSLELNESELEMVAGGGQGYPKPDTNTAGGPGGCSSNYYGMNCQATVDAGSHCLCTDYKTATYEPTKR